MARPKRKKEDKDAEEKLLHELVIEILSWLPAEYLWPLRCVSKTWLHLITLDPEFAQLHCNRSIQSNATNPNPSIINVSREDTGEEYFSLAAGYTACDKAVQLKFPFYPGCYIPSAICNGLLFSSCNRNTNLYLWNPLIYDCITIPTPPAPTIRFPEMVRDSAFGFGFDHVRNQYKVVRYFCEFDSSVTALRSQVSVYTLAVDASWRNLQQLDNQQDLVPSSQTIIHVNGVLHWLTRRQGGHADILAFDVKDEVFQEILFPTAIKSSEEHPEEEGFMLIGELGGLLCLFIEFDSEWEIDIWTMKEHGVVSSWTKQSIRFETPQGYHIDCYFRVSGLARDGEFILKKILRSTSDQDELCLYNPETNLFGELKQFQEPLDREYIFIGSIIAPSVISRARKSLTGEQT